MIKEKTSNNVELRTQALFSDITQTLGEHYNWQWDDRKNAVLSEFSRDKKELTLAVLQQNFSHQWHTKSIKKAPKSLKKQLGDLTKLNKEQLLFTKPATANSPALLAIWWPWGHGATVSLRFMPLVNDYQYDEASAQDNEFSLLSWFKNYFN